MGVRKEKHVRRAVSSAVALLVAILLIGTFASALLYISGLQMQNIGEGTKPVEQLSEAERERVDAQLVASGDGLFNVKVKNTGLVTLKITQALITKPDKSLVVVDIDPDVTLVVLEEAEVTIPYSGSFQAIALQTERGNVFPVVAAPVLQQQQATYTLTFYIRDEGGNAVRGATIIFNGASYSDGQSVNVAAGTYSLSTGNTPSGYTFASWEAQGNVAVASATFASTTATVSGSGSITLRLATSPQQSAVTVTFSVSGIGSDATGTILTVDGAPYTYADLPKSFTWDVGSTHSFAWADTVSAGSGKRYVWSSTSGLSTARSGTITVPPGGGSVQAAYSVEYQLTISVSPSGAGTTSPAAGSYWHASGQIVSVSATPGAGYTFSKWQLDGSDYSASNPVSVTMDSPHTLTAVFTGATYTLTVYVYRSGTSTGIQGVTVRVDGAPYTTDSSGRVSLSVSGGTHTVEIVSPYSPSSGARYVFTQWSDGSAASQRTVAVSSNTELTAYMKLEYYLTMQVGGGSGTVSPGSGWYDAGSSVPISASPSAGYAFDCWVGSGAGSYSGTSSSATITVNGPITQTAYFYTFSVSVSPDSGSTTPGGSVSATVTVTLIGGYYSITVSLSASGLPPGASASFSPSSVIVSPGSPTAASTMVVATSASTPTGAYTITITGLEGVLSKSTTYALTVTTQTYTVQFYIYDDAGNAVSGASLNFAGSSYSHGGSTSIASGSYSLSVGSIPGNYRFSRWEVSGGVSIASQAASSTTATISGSGAITMRLQRVATVTFSASGIGSDASGTVLVVDGASYSQLPVTFTWDVGSTHSFTWTDTVSAGSNKRYAWSSTSGLSTARSGTITVPAGGGSVTATYKTQYGLSISVSPSGAGTTSPAPGDYWYDAGQSVSVSATPGAGYTFSHWLLDGSNAGSSNPISVAMNAPHTLTAVFTGTSYTLTVYVYRSGTSTGIQGVTVRVDGAPYTTDSSGRVAVTVTYGSHTVEIVSPYSPSSDTRYVFTQWSDGLTGNPRTISISSATTLTAYMRREYRLTVNVNPAGGGSVSANPSSSDWFYQEGASVTLTATAASGYAFDAWTGDASGTGTSTSVTMSSPRVVTANFFTFSISVSPTSGSVAAGSTTATVTVTYQGGVNSKSISLSASGLPSGASASFSPSSVTISPGSPTASSTMTISTSSSTPAGTYTITISGSGGGVSKQASYTLTVNPTTYTISFQVLDDAGSAVSGATLVFDGVSYSHGGSTSKPAGSFSLSIGNIPSGYRFSQWQASGSITISNPSSSSTTATVSGSGTITLRLQRTATVTFSVSGMGSDASGTVLTVDGVSYSYSSLPVTFTWDVGSTHSFTWTDTVSAGSNKRYVWSSTSGLSTARSGSITVPAGGGSVQAAYRTQYYVTIQPSPSWGGSTSPSSGWYDAGSSVSISATPASGWAFERWVGSGAGSYSGTSSSATITVNGPITQTAYFYTFSVSVSPSSGSVTAGGSATATVTVTLSGGYSSSVAVSLSASGLPSGATASFSPSSVTVSPSQTTASSTITISTSPSTPAGTYTITVTVSGGGLSRTASYTLTVNVPFDFSISVSPASGSVTAGGSVTATVTVSLVSGSTATVSLTASGLPSGATVSFSPSSGSPTFTSTMTISTSSSTPVGTYTITITGSGGGLTRTATYTLTVNPRMATVVFYARFWRYNSYQNAWGDAIVLYVDGNAYTAAQVGSGVSFNWPVGSQHSVSWVGAVYYDESSYISGTDARYEWTYSSGIFSYQSGTLTVPSDGGTVTAYYRRVLYVITGVSPSGAGSVSPGTGWYLEGTAFTATASSGYQFSNWIVRRGFGSETQSTYNPYYMYEPGYLTATFTTMLPVTFQVYDYEGYPISGASCYIYRASDNALVWSGTTNSQGSASTSVPPGTYHVAVLQTTNNLGYTVYLIDFDGSSNPVKANVYISSPKTFFAMYETPISYMSAEARLDPIFTVVTVEGQIRSVHGTGVAGASILAEFYYTVADQPWMPPVIIYDSETTTTTGGGRFSVSNYPEALGDPLNLVYLVDIHLRITNAPRGYRDCVSPIGLVLRR